MPFLSKAIKTIQTRPFYICKYVFEAVRFTVNNIYWKIAHGKQIQTGCNLHTLTLSCFQAERPNAHISIGDNFVCYYGVKISAWGQGRITAENFCSIGSGTRITSRESITLGNHVVISWNVLISDFEGHPVDPEERKKEIEYSITNIFPQFKRNKTSEKDSTFKPEFKSNPITIGDNVWIGTRTVILKGVTIGEGSVIGAGSVVTHDIPPHSIAAGNPAKIIKEIDSANE